MQKVQSIHNAFTGTVMIKGTEDSDPDYCLHIAQCTGKDARKNAAMIEQAMNSYETHPSLLEAFQLAMADPTGGSAAQDRALKQLIDQAILQHHEFLERQE